MNVFLRSLLLAMVCGLTIDEASAQLTAPSPVVPAADRYATLEEQLTNRLRATRDDQQAYIQFVVEQVRAGKLEASLVIAIEKYALRRNEGYPFPFFERALKHEAAKRGVALPPVKHFSTTKLPSQQLDR